MLKFVIIFGVVAAIGLALLWARGRFSADDPVAIERHHMERVAVMVLLFRKQHGTLPATLADAHSLDPTCDFTDIWSTPIRYQSDGETFLMASAGADRLFDTADDIIFNLQKSSTDNDSSQTHRMSPHETPSVDNEKKNK